MATDANSSSDDGRSAKNIAPEKGKEDKPKPTELQTTAPSPLVDIGINLTHRALRKHWREVVQRAIDAGVPTMLLTGTSVRSSEECLKIAREWEDESGKANLLCTVGVHPHDAKGFLRSPGGGRLGIEMSSEAGGDGREGRSKGTIERMRELLTNDPLAVAVGECGLDYNRNFSSRIDQVNAFREQAILACELGVPLFVHEREAHEDLVDVLDSIQADESVPRLPPVVVHCFTGTKEEAHAYLDRGFFVGFTGTICKKERGAPLRELLPSIPLDRIMVETDAPFMGFVKGRRRHSEPAHVVGVAEEIARVHGVSVEEVCRATTRTACQFFGIEIPNPSIA
mmetsp:Transcript_35276/g.105377  ORF Transcript_35276/g.105377 Transcript_35276/m.105377 type:complete len:340 (-) Transcript_35276:131-1150(-)|eukprot:CAMPEP_0113548862 /NCGR_PEP_ID=MMETSP0015_2-20120614/13119_1 /TAXON_ID=2838 /ORGANISM="Odontella" /LENGTH=339 /DNA_ID=CAMNT_0000449519 /DNA_START=196 /DNA_END=1215 /DNA_ORIENTATION=+ /assembly_acc=CAM_ASM_000160